MKLFIFVTTAIILSGVAIFYSPLFSHSISFDTKERIPNSPITFLYPKNGFTKTGITINPYHSDQGSVHSESLISGVQIESGKIQENDLVIWTIELYKKNVGTTLIDIKEIFKQFVPETEIDGGTIKVINGKQYFIFKNDSEVRAILTQDTSWLLVTMVGSYTEKHFFKALRHISLSH